MNKRIPIIMAVALTFLVAFVWAADVGGKWEAETQGRQGPQTTTFNFKVEGTSLTGTIATSRGENPISEGKIDGNNISFVLVRMVGPNQDMEMKTTYKGVVSGDEIKFTVERQMPAGMGGPGGGPDGGPGGGPGGPGGAPGGGMGGGMGGGPQEIVAKRVK